MKEFIEDADVLKVIEELEESEDVEYEMNDYNVKINEIFDAWKLKMLM